MTRIQSKVGVALVGITFVLGAACAKDDRAQVAAQKAQESADKAQTAANEAQVKADQAKVKADQDRITAQKTADLAQAKADQAAADAKVKGDEAGKKDTTGVNDLLKERDKMVAQWRASLLELDGKIAKLETRAKARADKTGEAQMIELRKVRLEADVALQNAREADSQAWGRIKPVLDTTMNRVQAAYDEAEKAVDRK